MSIFNGGYIEPTLTVEQYKLLLDHFPGNVVLADKDGIIIYVNRRCLELWKDEPHSLVGQHASVFRTSGFAPETGNEYVLKYKKRYIKYLMTKHGAGILTASIPILDDANELRYILTFSFAEEMVYEYVKLIEQEKNNMRQLVDYLSKSDDKIIAKSKSMVKIFELIRELRTVDSSIMILGESGSGKEVIARYIHETSERCRQPFVPVNCAAVPNELMESEFFGYEQGAFTGAEKGGKLGLFQLADKGTLFLDEIAEMPLTLQAKFLRVLETGEIRRVGGAKYTYSDVRIIVATNRDLYDMVQKRTFRDDLYYRLNIMPIQIPPLRERKEDIEALCYFFLELYNKKYGYNKILTPQVIEVFKHYNWPGNVRELKNTIERLVIVGKSEIVELPLNFLVDRRVKEEPFRDDSRDRRHLVSDFGSAEPDPATLKEGVAAYEKQYIMRAIQSCNGNVVQTAKKIGLSTSGIYKKISMYDISLRRVCSSN